MKLKGGVIYHDGQFDDARMLIALIKSITDLGGHALNYCRVTGLLKDKEGKITGVRAGQAEQSTQVEIHSRIVINATGVFADELLKMDHPLINRTIRPSQGIHLVFDREFLKSDSAMMIPKTDDGRVLFAIPWYGKVVAGTTDTPLDTISLEPKALEAEIEFILETAGKYFSKPPARKDILCVFAGLRPLAASPEDPKNTREISRRHKITIASSGLVSTEGGKWTTYRRMAQDTLDKIMRAGLLEYKPCVTRNLHLHGYTVENHPGRLSFYGIHAPEIDRMMDMNNGQHRIHAKLPYTVAEIRWICRNEMPQKLEDVLSRRTRSLLLDARASREMAPEVAGIMAEEMGLDENWRNTEIEAYNKLVENYICEG
jgi:glycerol-3-phosphate dehydrogenase